MSGLNKTFLIFLMAVNLPLQSESSINKAKSGQQPIGGIAMRFDCLPEGYRSTDVVSYRHKSKGGEGNLTIEDKLVELKAHCREGKLVDGKGREIRFFRIACFGNPPSDYEELRQKELEELEKLQKQYCVIVMECDPRIS